MSHYGVMLAEYTCLRQTTHLHCPLKVYKAVVGTHLPLFGHVVTERQPFKLPIGLILSHLTTGGVDEPLWCDACRVLLP